MDELHQLLAQTQAWLIHAVLPASCQLQLAVVLAAFLMAWLISRLFIRPWMELKIAPDQPRTWRKMGAYLAYRLSTPAILVFLMWLAQGVAHHYLWPRQWLNHTLLISLAWILTRGFIIIIFNLRQLTSRLISVSITLTIWMVTVLAMADLLGEAMLLLDSIAVKLGGFRVSLLHLMEAALILMVFLILSRAAGDAFSNWIASRPNVSPSLQALSNKLFKMGLYTLAIILAMGGLGMDLTNLAWLSGALGLGIGFGLQKVISNVASGFIILADKSIKPGDVIQVGETYGWVNHLKSRYVSVLTRDGVEYLIPNEDLVTGKVVNWSYSNNLVRVKIPVGVSYEADLALAMQLMLEAAAAAPRVLPRPEPSCRLMSFGDSAIDFQIRVWINDPKEGLAGVRNGVYLEIWKRFKERGIDIPYPQRVLHFKPPPDQQAPPTEP
jgi:small-conductance mechanosensitive channel